MSEAEGVGIAGRRRVDDRAAVRAAVPAAHALRVARNLAVVVRADHVDGVGQAGRRVDVFVVPALARAEVIRRVVRARGRVRRQLLPAVVGRRERIAVPGGTVEPAACEASSAAAVWPALSVRQKLDGCVPPLAVPSVR